MKRPAPRSIRLLRVVSIVVSLISLLLISSVVYSAYADYRALTDQIGGSGAGRATLGAVQEGQSVLVTLNATVPNSGLYAIVVTMSCTGNPNLVQCDPARVTVPPGQVSRLTFHLTILNIAEYMAEPVHEINGTLFVDLVPFSSLSVGFDLGALVDQAVRQ
ncbi:MAG: hypothetical protein HY297_03450 [Thaumarchaeota archaeon]|nr:hypothetical protein [Nitrososphaerota archaeon]